MAKKVSIELTENEFNEIWHILSNGWGFGEIAGQRGSNLATQNRALEKFNRAFYNLKGGHPAAPFLRSVRWEDY